MPVRAGMSKPAYQAAILEALKEAPETGHPLAELADMLFECPFGTPMITRLSCPCGMVSASAGAS